MITIGEIVAALGGLLLGGIIVGAWFIAHPDAARAIVDGEDEEG